MMKKIVYLVKDKIAPHPTNKIRLGNIAEQEACQFLQKKNFQLIERNYRCFHGEIDLIMQDQDDIVFVEVRSRSRSDYGSALESINKSKRSKIIKAAKHFLCAKGWMYKVNSRFDIIAIQRTVGKTYLEWIKNAFSVENGYHYEQHY